MIRIVDASAIGAVLLVERDAAWVSEQTDGIELVAPAILPFEVGNICWKRLRHSAAEADSVMAIWTAWTASLPVRLVMPDLKGTLRLAYETALTFYDASYVRVALDHHADLISLDVRLVREARKLGVHVPTPHATHRSRN